MGRFLFAMALASVLTGSALLVKPSTCFTSEIKVGFFYYVWYEAGLGNGHWNGTPPDDPTSLAWKVVDTPILGFYNSQNTSVIKQHLEWFKELGINFLIISWWGPNSYEDNSTKIIFSVVEQDHPIEIAIMVEAYNHSGVYNFTVIYDYIHDNYALQSKYMKLNEKPLVCFFNDCNMTGNKTMQDAIHNDSRFSSKIVGHNDYVDWYAWRPCSVDREGYPDVLPRLSKDGFTCIEPRYDDSHIGRTYTFDENYSDGLYDRQWNKALEYREEGNLSIVAVYSWNEYHERSQIEPHIADGKYILSPFCKTYHYVQVIPEFSSFLILPIFMTTTLTAVIVYRRKHAIEREANY